MVLRSIVYSVINPWLTLCRGFVGPSAAPGDVIRLEFPGEHVASERRPDAARCTELRALCHPQRILAQGNRDEGSERNTVVFQIVRYKSGQYFI